MKVDVGSWIRIVALSLLAALPGHAAAQAYPV